MIGFRGELTYLSGTTTTDSAKRFFTVDDSCVFGETNATCLNAGGQTLQIGRCKLYNAVGGVELHTGDFGGYVRARMYNLAGAGVIWGGVVNHNQALGLYHYFTRSMSGDLPLCDLDLYLDRCVNIYLGSALTGRITCVDTLVSLGDLSSMSECKSTDLEIVSFVDKTDLVSGVYLTGGAGTGDQTTVGVSVRLHCKRTANAVANGFKHQKAVTYYGSFGPDVRVDVATFENAPYAQLIGFGTVYDNHPGVTISRFDESMNTVEYDIEANAGGTFPYNPYAGLRCGGSASGGYTMYLPTAGIQRGAEMRIMNMTPNYTSGGVALRFSGSQFRDGKDRLIPASYAMARVRFNGGRWEWIEGINELSGSTTWNPGSIANGAQELKTVVVKGAVLGDRAEVALSVSTGGLVLTGAVTAPNTVTATLSNNSGAAIDLGNATLNATVRA